MADDDKGSLTVKIEGGVRLEKRISLFNGYVEVATVLFWNRTWHHWFTELTRNPLSNLCVLQMRYNHRRYHRQRHLRVANGRSPELRQCRIVSRDLAGVRNFQHSRSAVLCW